MKLYVFCSYKIHIQVITTYKFVLSCTYLQIRSLISSSNMNYIQHNKIPFKNSQSLKYQYFSVLHSNFLRMSFNSLFFLLSFFFNKLLISYLISIFSLVVHDFLTSISKHEPINRYEYFLRVVKCCTLCTNNIKNKQQHFLVTVLVHRFQMIS